MLPYLATIVVLVVVYGRAASRRRARSALAEGPAEVEVADLTPGRPIVPQRGDT